MKDGFAKELVFSHFMVWPTIFPPVKQLHQKSFIRKHRYFLDKISHELGRRVVLDIPVSPFLYKTVWALRPFTD